MPTESTCDWCSGVYVTAPSKAKRLGSGYCNARCYGDALQARALERFWERVDRRGPAECWPWTGGRNRRGYGKARWNKVPTNAHRVAYFLANDIEHDRDTYICHRCDNPPCCNPDHLFRGTAADNAADCVSKGRSARGERQHLCRLTAQDVRMIRERFDAGGETYSSLGRRYGVSHQTIRNAVLRNTWGHVR